MAKRRIIAEAKIENEKIKISCSVEIGTLYTKDEQDQRLNKIRDSIFDMLRGRGYHCHQIKIK